MKTISAPCFFVVAALAIVLHSGHGRAQQDFDRERYHRAVEYCRGSVSRPMALSPDRRILCFDGGVEEDLNVSPAWGLEENGLFVVRSEGGHPSSTTALSRIVRDRHATVVVHDYCYSACAMLFLIASHQSYVLKGALVLWHYPQYRDPARALCTYLIEPDDDKPKKLQRGPCGLTAAFKGSMNLSYEVAGFLSERVIARSFDLPPDSLHVRRMLRNLYGDTGVFRDIPWTLHPRYYPVLFKTKIFYEAYPQSQEEVDGMAARLGLARVIYDP